MDALAELAQRWREEAETLRCYGAERLATAAERHADELEAAAGAARIEAVTLEEAAQIGGYSYSHLQHLVAEDTIPNVGEKGDPRIRRSDVPVKPGHGRRREKPASTKGELLDADVLEMRRRRADS